MMIISEESYERVREMIEDIGYCCEIEDDYNGWEDIAASSMAQFLDGLDNEQLEMTVAALEEYIIDTADSDMNMAMGVKTALARYFRERLDYFKTYVVSDALLNLDEDEEYEDTDTAVLENILVYLQNKVNKIQIGE